MTGRLPGLALGLLLIGQVANAAPPVRDPDWPCVQRYQPTLTAGTYWTGPPPASDWHANPQIATLVTTIAPRTVPLDAAVRQLNDFVAGLPASNRDAELAIVFAGLVDETNRQRDGIVARLRALTRRQREITHIVEGIPTPAPNADPATDEVTQRRGFLLREFDGTERTIRYACEIPVSLEARLGEFGRILEAARPQ